MNEVTQSLWPMMTRDSESLGPSGFSSVRSSKSFREYPRVRYHNIIFEDEKTSSDEDGRSAEDKPPSLTTGDEVDGCDVSSSLQSSPTSIENIFSKCEKSSLATPVNGAVYRASNSTIPQLSSGASQLLEIMKNPARDVHNYSDLLQTKTSPSNQPNSQFASPVSVSPSSQKNNISKTSSIGYNGSYSGSPTTRESTPFCDAASSARTSFDHMQVFPSNLHCSGQSGPVSEAFMNHTHSGSTFMEPSMNGMQQLSHASRPASHLPPTPSTHKNNFTNFSSASSNNRESKRQIQPLANGLSSFNVFGSTGSSDFEYKKYMRLLRSNSFGSFGDIKDKIVPLSAAPENNLNTDSDMSSSILANHLGRSFNDLPSNSPSSSVCPVSDGSPTMTSALKDNNSQNGHHDLAPRKSSVRKPTWFGSNGINPPYLFTTITDIDIEDNNNKETSLASDKRYSMNESGRLWDSNKLIGSTKSVDPYRTTAASYSKDTPRRNSIAFSGQWSDIDSTNATDWLYHRNGLSKSVFSAVDKDIDGYILPEKKLRSINGEVETNKTNTKTNSKKLMQSTKRENDFNDQYCDGDRLSKLIPYDNWRNSISHQFNSHDEVNGSSPLSCSEDDRGKQGFHKTSSEFNAIHNGKHVDNKEQPAADMSQHDLSSVGKLLDHFPKRSYSTKRRNSISGISKSDERYLNYDNTCDSSNNFRKTDKFVFGNRRNKRAERCRDNVTATPTIKTSGTSALNPCRARGDTETSTRLFASFDDIVNKCPNGNRETLNSYASECNRYSPRKAKSPRRVDSDSAEAKQLLKLIEDSRRVFANNGNLKNHFENLKATDSRKLVGSSLTPDNDANNSLNPRKTELLDLEENTISESDNAKRGKSKISIANKALGRFPTDDCELNSGDYDNAHQPSKLVDPGRAKVHHCFGLRNFQNSQQNLNSTGVPSKLLIETGDDDSTSFSSSKPLQPRKVSRRMTTSGLVRPALQKFVALGAQRLLKRPDQSQKSEFASENKNLIPSLGGKLYRHHDIGNSTHSLNEFDDSSKYQPNLYSQSNSYDNVNDDKRSESSGTSDSSQKSQLFCDPTRENGNLLDNFNENDPPPVVRPPRKKKSTHKNKHNKDRHPSKEMEVNSTRELLFAAEKLNSSKNNRLAYFTNRRKDEGVTRDRDIGTSVDSPINSRKLLASNKNSSSGEKSSRIKLLSQVRKRIKSGNRGHDRGVCCHAEANSLSHQVSCVDFFLSCNRVWAITLWCILECHCQFVKILAQRVLY